jgi:hypothetical protein
MNNSELSLLAEVTACRHILEDYVKRLDEACVEYYENGKKLFPNLSRGESEGLSKQCEVTLSQLMPIIPDAINRWKSIHYPINQYDEEIERGRDFWVRRQNLLKQIEISLTTQLGLHSALAEQTKKIGRTADLQIDGVNVGYLKGVTTKGKNELVKDYSSTFQTGDLPLGIPSQSDEFIMADLMYVDNKYVNLVLGNTDNMSIVINPIGSTNASIVFGSVGSSAGVSREIYNNCSFVGGDIKREQDGIIGQNVCWKASVVTLEHAPEKPSQNRPRTNVFISYSHVDTNWLNKLRVHLKPLERNGIEIWDDNKIKPGANWHEEIKNALKSTKVALLLVSGSFLASDFIINNELPNLLWAAKNEGATILSLIISPCRFEETTSISQFQALNAPSKPLRAMNTNERDVLFVKVAKTIENILLPQKTSS